MLRRPQANNLMERLEWARKITELLDPAAQTKSYYDDVVCSLASRIHFDGLNKPLLYAKDVTNAIESAKRNSGQ